MYIRQSCKSGRAFRVGLGLFGSGSGLNVCVCFQRNCVCVFNESFPLMKKKLHHPKNNWFDRELKELLIKKEKLFKKFCTQKNIFTKTRINKARNEYFRAIKTKKQAYYASLFKKQNNNLKQTWRAINDLLGKAKPKSCSSLKINNQIVNDVKQITNHFNQYFSNVGYALRKSCLSLAVTSKHIYQNLLPNLFILIL